MSSAGDLTTERGLRSRLRMLSAVRALSVMLPLCSAWAVHVLAGVPTGWTAVLAVLGGGVAVLLSDRRAAAVAVVIRDQFDRELQQQRAVDGERLRSESQQHHTTVLKWLQHFDSMVAEGRKGIACALEQIERGERPSAAVSGPAGDWTGDPFTDFAHALSQAQSEAMEAVVTAAAGRPKATGSAPERAEVFVHIAQRLHALVSRTLEALTVLENGVEDPDFLHGLFVIDSLVTRTRRAAESIAVLGDKRARNVTSPLLLRTVLRQGIAEIEQYERVRLPQPREDVALPGYAGPDVIHLLAELAENATNFSPGTTQVLMRTSDVPAGLVIEIEDRGLPMSSEKLARVNRLLASPEEVDVREQMKEGIGLLVAARLGQRHNIRIELRPNLLGGTQAIVVLPKALLIAPDPLAQRAAMPSDTAASVPARDPLGNVAVGALPPAAAPTAPTAEPHQGAGSPRDPLPQRRRVAAAAPGPTAQRAVAAPAAAEGRRPLPRRSEVQQQVHLPDPAKQDAASGPATAGLMASYADGVQRGADETAPKGPLPGSPTG